MAIKGGRVFSRERLLGKRVLYACKESSSKPGDWSINNGNFGVPGY